MSNKNEGDASTNSNWAENEVKAQYAEIQMGECS